jgi:putative membrane protein
VRTHVRSLVPAAALVLLIGASACSKQNTTSSNTGTTTNPSETPSASSGASGPMSDANIAAIVTTANDIDVKNGEMAKSKTKNSEVRALAEQMITDHQSVNKQAKDLVDKLHVSPEDNDVSRQLKTMADSTRDAMKTHDGTAFDKAYVDNEVAYHQAVIDMVNNQLVPSAQNPELKSLLENSKPTFMAHLEHAKKVQADLSRNPQ